MYKSLRMKNDKLQKRKLKLNKKTIIRLNERSAFNVGGMMPSADCPTMVGATCPKNTDGVQYSCKQNNECFPQASKAAIDTCACPKRPF